MKVSQPFASASGLRRVGQALRPRPGHVAVMLGIMGMVAHAQQATPAAAGSNNATAETAAGTAPTPAADSRTLPAVVVRDSAQDPQGPGVGYVAKRSKTGTKTDSALITNPQSISVVTRQQMDDLGVQTIDQALRYTPGVYTQDGTDVRFDQISGRGFTLDSYLDGLHLYQSQRFATPRIDPYFLDRIDVLHGPASVLYGQGSPGGLVNYSSKLPTDTPYHEIMAQIGNHNTYQLGFDFSGPVDQAGTVLYRVTGVARDAETQVSQIKDQRLAIAPSVTLKPDHDTTLTLQGSFQRDPNGGLFDVVPANGTLFANRNGRLGPDQYFGDPNRDDMQRTQYWFGYQFDRRLNDTFSISQNVRYLHIDQQYYQTSITGAPAINGATAPIFANTDHEHYSQFEADTHAQAKFATGDIKHTVLFGLDYQRVTLGDDYGGAVVGTANIFNRNFSTLPTVKANTRLDAGSSTVGLYTQDEMRYRNWVLTLGLREDFVGTNQESATATASPVSHANDHAFTYRAGLAYEFDNGIVPFISYAKSFQPILGLTFSSAPFQPTTGKQVEAGVRYQPKSFDGYFTLSGYSLTQNNVSVPDPIHPTFSVQTGQVRSRGIEAEAHANVTSNIKLIASYAYLNQLVTESTTVNLGKRPPIAPRHTAAVWGDYTQHTGPLRNLGGGVGVRYVSSSEGDQLDSFTVPARVLVDLGVHYTLKDWSLALNVNNLFNREYISYCSLASVCYWGSTRTILGTARYTW